MKANTNITTSDGMGKHNHPPQDKAKPSIAGSGDTSPGKVKQGESSAIPPAGQEKTEKKTTKKSKKKDKSDSVAQAPGGNSNDCFFLCLCQRSEGNETLNFCSISHLFF